jgi:hypothetical protein
MELIFLGLLFLAGFVIIPIMFFLGFILLKILIIGIVIMSLVVGFVGWIGLFVTAGFVVYLFFYWIFAGNKQARN